MIIYKDSLIVLEYDVKTDILIVKWPNLVDVPTPVILETFKRLSDAIKHYNISNLLLDSKDTVSRTNDPEYKPLAMQLVADLAASNLKRIARVVSEDEEREARAKKISEEAASKMHFSFISKEFTNRPEAIAWLVSSEN